MKRLTSQDFIRKASAMHNNRYDYSLIQYVNNTTYIDIICPEHGVFSKCPAHHLRGQGCQKCAIEKRNIKRSLDTEGFISRSQNVHGNHYGYALVQYKNSITKVKIICPIHGEFEQLPSNHMRGAGCQKCGESVIGDILRHSYTEFLIKAHHVHGNRYTYLEESYGGSRSNVKIICPTHGEFEQTPTNHLRGQNCPLCALLGKSGKNCYLYKDGKSSERDKERDSPKARKWTKTIKQDTTHCDCCGTKFYTGLSKHAHHLNSWIDHPEERYDPNNGVCICEICHNDFHSEYGYGGNTRIQYEEFKEGKYE